MYKTFVNQPERVFLSSTDDVTTVAEGQYYSYQIQLNTPIVGLKKCQLLRATIPNIQVNIPNYQLVFWYYALFNQTDGRDIATLRCVRLLPTNSLSDLAGAPYNVPINNYYNDPTELVAALNAAAASADDPTANPYFVQNDISFAYDVNTKKISFTGTEVGRWYVPAGWNDPILAQAAANLSLTAGQAPPPQQPFVAGYIMNLRLGYAQPGGALPRRQYGGIYLPQPDGTPYQAESYPDLVYTGNIYLYCNIVPGSSLGSNGKHNLLTVIPNNAPSLSVTNYTALMINWLTKVATEVYEIRIEMYDDAGQPYYLPDSAVTNIEMAFGYKDESGYKC